MVESKQYTEGFNAYMSGVRANPYTTEAESMQWEFGWNDAYEANGWE